MATMDTATVNHPTVDDVILFSGLTLLDPKPVGCGAFGAVFKALHDEWGFQVAYKKLDLHLITERNRADKQLIQSLKYEADIHRQLRHPNIVSMLGIVYEPKNYGIILEYVMCGSWANFRSYCVTEAHDLSCIPWSLKANLVYEISSGMSYLHSLKIVHCDLKVQNILVGEQVNAKISDFGMSKWKNYSRSHSMAAGMNQGTPSHISPEQWKDLNHPASYKCDVYSFSILLWEMFTEKEAYEGRRAIIRDWVLSNQRLPLEHIPADVPTEIHAMIKSCWDPEAEKRPSFSNLADKLRLFLRGYTSEQIMKTAKATVLSVYHKSLTTDLNQHDSDHCQKIKKFQQIFCNFLRRTDQILTILVQERVVSTSEQESISSPHLNLFDKAKQLIDVISGKSLEGYECFLKALDATNQHHLHRVIEETDYNHDEQHKVTIIDNFIYLKDNITHTDSLLLDTLLSAGVLDEREISTIRSKLTDHEKTDLLLQLILRTSSKEYEIFLESLKKANHQHVYNKLKEKPHVEHIVEEDLKLSVYLAKPTWHHMLTENKNIRGVAIMDNKLYVVQGSDRDVMVYIYDSTGYEFIRTIIIPDSLISTIVACQESSCLYLSDDKKQKIYRKKKKVPTATLR